MDDKKRENIEKLAECLKGTAQNLTDELAADHDVDMGDQETCDLFDTLVFECECCGWWCGTDEYGAKEGCCDECEPNGEDAD